MSHLVNVQPDLHAMPEKRQNVISKIKLGAQFFKCAFSQYSRNFAIERKRRESTLAACNSYLDFRRVFHLTNPAIPEFEAN